MQKYVRWSSRSCFAIHEQGKLLPCDVAVLVVGVLYAVAAELGRVLLYLGQVVGPVRIGVLKLARDLVGRVQCVGGFVHADCFIT